MRALKFRLLKPPRARLAAVMMMMMPAQLHNHETVAKMSSFVKGLRRTGCLTVLGISTRHHVVRLAGIQALANRLLQRWQRAVRAWRKSFAELGQAIRQLVQCRQSVPEHGPGIEPTSRVV